jgi:hypothetical protein
VHEYLKSDGTPGRTDTGLFAFRVGVQSLSPSSDAPPRHSDSGLGRRRKGRVVT